MIKLKAKDIKPFRETMLRDQHNICAICGAPIIIEKAVLDHDHKTGQIREVLHASCNSFLGIIENNHKRFGVEDLEATLAGIYKYVTKHASLSPDVIHPTHRTPDEKKALAAKRRKAKAKKEKK